MIRNVFNQADTSELINRINKLTPTAQPLWGKMSVAQMLAHCNVTYEMAYEDIHPKPKGFKKLLLRTIVKNIVVSEKPFKKDGPTAPQFIITSDKDFNKEKNRMIDYINRTQQLGAAHFDGMESHSFGKLTATEWNNMFYKHLDHHLTQFGV